MSGTRWEAIQASVDAREQRGLRLLQTRRLLSIDGIVRGGLAYEKGHFSVLPESIEVCGSCRQDVEPVPLVVNRWKTVLLGRTIERRVPVSSEVCGSCGHGAHKGPPWGAR